MNQTETLRDYIAMDGSVLKARTTKELHPVNRFRVMFGQPLLPDSQTEGMPHRLMAKIDRILTPKHG